MIGILILAHRTLGAGLIEAVEHTLGERPPQLEAVAIDYTESPEQMKAAIEQSLARLDRGGGVLILADLYGATHTNVACGSLQRGRIELIAGVNLPMLLRALNYRGLPMDELIDRALSGGSGGMVCATNPRKLREAGR